METPSVLHLACPRCLTANRVPRERLGEDPKCGKCGAPLADGAPVPLSEAQFDAFVSRSDLPVLVDFWAPWCGPCRQIAPVIEELAGENSGSIKFGKLNVDNAPAAAQNYGVRSIPTLMVFKNGEVVERFVGVQPKSRLQQALDAAKT